MFLLRELPLAGGSEASLAADQLAIRQELFVGRGVVLLVAMVLEAIEWLLIAWLLSVMRECKLIQAVLR